ncbi:ABC transporter permease [Spirilliplanes yamanashiensis]|uniref:Transporter n=1 Tax=Spirilliplanes yamanashiensis TaxID=42233 RepID=A0A8J4DJ03_9ACTN|nr:ABC transporter permease [Spirilliplanes yamanashiensis]MDP9814851.1 ABC-2 type transport system permease protein [Spirilliplanes yamanashiensis]GIJ02505.1 transporter [Spirilliplanes yamanashiensis]
MAVTALPVAATRPVSTGHFVRLKLRVTANGLRGATWKIILFVLGVFYALLFAAGGFVLFMLPGALDSVRGYGIAAALGGALLVLGWLLLPLVFFGVDESLDPARFALLPLPRRTLVKGLFAAALTGIPAVATLIATGGLVLGAILLDGVAAGLAAFVGVVSGLLLCVALSRAVTSAFASALRSRRSRDLAAVLLAVLATLIAPLQLVVMNGAAATDWARFAGAVTVVGWTPLGAPYTLGADVAEGRWWAVPLKLVIVGVTIAGLLAWWSRSLESAMIGTAAGGGPAAVGRRGRALTPTQRLLAGGLPRNRFGALVGREVRYWWREARRRAGVITFAVVGIVLPISISMSNDDAGLTAASISMIFVGALAAVNLANQFGYEGTAYAANVVAAVPGRAELHSRVLGLTVYVAPIMGVVAVVISSLAGRPEWIPALAGILLAAYGTGLAAVLPVSILGAYAMPDTSNPFAISSGGGMAKSLYSFAAMLVAAVLCAPYVIAGLLLGDAWLWAALPVGLVYGGAFYALGAHLSGKLLDRRMPELLQAVNPRH